MQIIYILYFQVQIIILVFKILKNCKSEAL